MRKKVYSLISVIPSSTFKRKVRKHLNADTLLAVVKEDFQKIPDKRSANRKIAMDDALMSALAVFQLKDPSLLAFDKRRQTEPENLHTVFGIKTIPSDSQMRTILDPIVPDLLRQPFSTVFRQLQRGKDMEKLVYLDGHYLLSGDGTGFYSSEKVSSEYCMGKKSKNGNIMYYQQMYAASFVNPNSKIVIPVYPEMITKQDGSKKNDCERNASKRFYNNFRKDHPHLKVIVVEDGLSSNGPHIRELQKHNLRFILGAKPKDHQALFSELSKSLRNGTATEFTVLDQDRKNIAHHFRFLNNVALNKANPDLLVNILEYWEVDKDGKVREFSWVTDIEITEENVFAIMRGGRARWKVENETFNTLKNQGYNLGHNYGLGKKYLSGVFTILMMLAFLIDQAQQLSCWLFRAVAEKAGTKRELWETIRSLFKQFKVDSMETILRAILEDFKIDISGRYSP